MASQRIPGSDLLSDVETFKDLENEVSSQQTDMLHWGGASSINGFEYTPSENNGDIATEEGKREFYAEAVRMKLQLPTNHPKKNAELPELYAEAVKRGLHKNHWVPFIKAYFGL